MTGYNKVNFTYLIWMYIGGIANLTLRPNKGGVFCFITECILFGWHSESLRPKMDEVARF